MPSHRRLACTDIPIAEDKMAIGKYRTYDAGLATPESRVTLSQMYRTAMATGGASTAPVSMASADTALEKI